MTHVPAAPHAPRRPGGGLLFIVSAPSGAGKTSMVRALLQRDAQVGLSVSYTTRPPRPGEVHGRDYHFVDRSEFEHMIERGDFLECATVHGNCYGTSERWVRSQLEAGADIVLEIDWQGAAQVRQRIEGATGIFILPPSIETLEARLRSRAQDSDAVIARRIAGAREEISHLAEFDYVIINDEFDRAVDDLHAVIRACRLRTPVQFAAHPGLQKL
jgi:guanylate kinase